LGVAFQILNDLNDWRGDDHNKLLAGGDVTGGRPTVLWALALEGLPEAERAELIALAARNEATPATIARIKKLYESAGVFDQATRLVDKYQERAEAVADEVEPEELRRLLYYLVDTVLERSAPETPQVFLLTLPIVS
jgi:geranylgeranyl pyrophosphate synthase